MLHTINPEILLLKQEDVIKAGLLDMKQILATVEKTYQLLGQGHITNPPKTHIGMPKDPDWASYINTMPCYIGGDVNICGVKLAAESKKNATIPGIPYGIDITILSDPETVLPFCILDGTIITAMRTSAVAATQAKFAAPANTTTATLIGAGVIGRTMVMAVSEAIPTIKTIYLADLDMAKAEAVAKEYQGINGVEIIPVSDAKAAAAKSQLIVGETTSRKPIMDESWIKPNSAIVCVSFDAGPDIVAKADNVCVDYWKQMKTFSNAPVSQLYNDGKITEDQFVELSELALGNKKLRENDEQFIYAGSIGLGALDIMVAYQMYENATKMGIGGKFNLWDKPLWE